MAALASLFAAACASAPPVLAPTAPPAMLFAAARKDAPTCAGGDAAECYRLDAACDQDDAGACELRARALVGENLQRNRRAYALHTRACHRGRGSACVEAGLLARDGRGMDPNPERALALFVLACNAGETRGCELEKVGGLDALVNARHARTACDGGASFACAALARMYEQGLGVPADRGMAHRLHRKACDGRVEESCRAIGEPETPETLEAPEPPRP